MRTKYYCIDCGTEISGSRAKRCRSCSQKGILNYRFGTGLPKKSLCECGDKKGRKSLNCRKCANKKHSENIKKLWKSKNCPFTVEFGEKSPHYIDGRKNRIYYCKICKINEINYYTFWLGQGRCRSCAKKEDGKWRLEDNPGWIDGKSFNPYPLGWNKTYKEQIRYRDRYKCQLCDTPEVECTQKLHVHHKDYDKNNIRPDNLISLCKSCHSKTNFNREYWKRYFTQYKNTISVLVKKSI